MSKAFVREQDGDAGADELPELPQEPVPNYVTPEGMEALAAWRERLAGERRELEARDGSLADSGRLAHVRRDLRYVEGRLDHAVVVHAAGQPRDRVAFGARVDVRDENGRTHSWRIVGENEADIGMGLVSWTSPLARALIDARPGDIVTWRRPVGDLELEVTGIDYG